MEEKDLFTKSSPAVYDIYRAIMEKLNLIGEVVVETKRIVRSLEKHESFRRCASKETLA